MKPTFWKISQGTEFFNYSEMLKSIDNRLVYVHKDTKGKATSNNTQGHDFINAKIGDYFYLTYGNEGIFILGQFIGPANFFSEHKDGLTDNLDSLHIQIKENLLSGNKNGGHLMIILLLLKYQKKNTSYLKN